MYNIYLFIKIVTYNNILPEKNNLFGTFIDTHRGNWYFMASTSSIPFSQVIKQKDDNGEEPKKKTREEWKKEKELEEARKAGTEPAVVDETGKDINPHIPQYISAAPWYIGANGPTLKHQRPQPEKEKSFDRLEKYYKRGLTGSKATKWRKGACENCGSMGHAKKECFERPRKRMARYTNCDIAADEVQMPNLALDYDGKRDRWNGFDASQYTAVVEEHQKVEDFKRQIKEQKLNEGQEMDGDEDDDNSEDEDKYADNFDMPGTKVDSKQRITVRNLRIREDTAKYLRNLDIESSYYDPKTRSMRDNPYADTNKKSDQVAYAGENFVRFSGDTVEQAKAQLFAWEAYEKGVDVSLQAEPTKLELLKKEFMKKKKDYKKNVSADLLHKYGGKQYLEAPPRELLLAQTEQYVEYSSQMKVIKGDGQAVVRSMYEEDVHPNNHVSVWGSFWRKGKWGYQCCHSSIKNSYCTGEAGKETNLAESLQISSPISHPSQTEPKTLVHLHQEEMLKKKHIDRNLTVEDDPLDDEQGLRKNKLRQALIQAKMDEDSSSMQNNLDDRQRSYNSMYENKKPSEEQLEAYQIRKIRTDDPMAKFIEEEND